MEYLAMLIIDYIAYTELEFTVSEDSTMRF